MITGVTIEMTTHCNRRCPECCAGVGINRVLQHHPWEYFERAAKVLYGIERVNLTGGEPTAHPMFPEFVPKFRKLFGCKVLTLSTNGYGVWGNAGLIAREFDWIDYSDYGDNRAALWLLRSYGATVNVYDAGLLGVNHISRATRGTGSCFRACAQSGMVAYADGKLYGCCVAPGITSAVAVPIQSRCEACKGVGAPWNNSASVPCDACGGSGKVTWRETIEAAPLPCGDCWFAT